MFYGRLDFWRILRDCSWKAMPRMVLAMDHEATRLIASGVRPRPHTIAELDQGQSTVQREKCGSPLEVLKGSSK